MARIAAPFGIKGWVKLQTYTEFADSLDEFATWFMQTPKGWEEIEVEQLHGVRGATVLIGAEVVNTLGDKLGRVETLMETGANDVLVVKSAEADDGQRLIPFVDEVIVNVDREAKVLTVNWGKDY